MTGNAAGRPPMGGERGPAEPNSYPSGNEPTTPSGNGNASAHREITANTQGVVGNPDLSLSTSGGTDMGSVVRSEKSNVKLDNGTLLLLRVNQ